MRIVLVIWVIVFGTLSVGAQADSLSTQLRSVGMAHASIIESLNLNKNNKSTFSFTKLNFEQSLPKNKTTAFFCVIEDKIFTTSKIPIRMRLGSLDYTNSMEGKNPFDLELSNTLSNPH